MQERKRVELICDACGRRGPVEMHMKLAEAVHSHNPQDKITEILCSKCSAEKASADSWSICVGPECES